ncbi:hypothetical protein GYMLUDRAFT_61634 [Collybiopsis luxurians FD-317 M1]|uniref:START domain-containing protein n=1 Tax=Collybiopsis luxurians FD-317 M1 TaxID=944289 RepID=A0A0D0CP34_9AGAR|nr:hypothetical protein GYMLUDRAFT_61634 [Collybiopsis luxurians FD-317 M1]
MVTLEPWKAVLTTPELRQEWDPAVSEAHLVELVGQDTRISKTNFTLGWPASPRDAVTISRTVNDATTVIDISTSLPRSPDEPAYLRPSPPYVRSHVSLLAWCIQYLKPSSDSKRKSSTTARIRITCFWQHDLRAIWNILGSSTTLVQQLSTMVLGLLKTTNKRATRVPKLIGHGNGVSIEKMRFQNDREALTIEYSVIPEDTHGAEASKGIDAIRDQRRLTRAIECVLPAVEGWDVQLTTRAFSEEVEKLPWTAYASRGTSYSYFSSAATSTDVIAPPLDQIILRITHAPLIDDHAVLKVKVVIEISGPSSGLRLNGVPQRVREVEELRDPSSLQQQQQQQQPLFTDGSVMTDVSTLYSGSIATTTTTSVASNSTLSVVSSGTGAGAGPGVGVVAPPLVRMPTTDSLNGAGLGTGERSAGAEKTILSRVKRNYIYFSSLLQEPEAKWKRTTEARGVTVTQLDSIDPTLVVYRAEATFVGVGLWDLYAAVVSPGARSFWDKQHEDAVLLEDVNELTELWHLKTKAAWPVNGRDSVVLKTVYKSPTTIHVFSFSISSSPPASASASASASSSSSSFSSPSTLPSEDQHLFPSTPIPPPSPTVIRTQVDLQGWAIEALSPNTTLLTLLEQSDPKGWTNNFKGSVIPGQMIGAVAGIGECVIRSGGPPVVTRLSGGRKREERYEVERGSFRLEYEGVGGGRRGAGVSGGARGMGGGMGGGSSNDDTNASTSSSSTSTSPVIECEIRCDMDTWAPSLDIVIDPPPQSVSCLRRHRLSDEGGGMWMTIVHDAVSLGDDERLQVIVRRGLGVFDRDGGRDGRDRDREGGRDRGLVMVNGAKQVVDVEEMGEQEIKMLSRRKRVKPPRIPLDQPPVVGVVRRRRQEWDGSGTGDESEGGSSAGIGAGAGGGGAGAAGSSSSSTLATSMPKVSSPLARFFSYAVDQAAATTQQTIAAISPSSKEDIAFASSSSGAEKAPVEYALDVLAWTQIYHGSTTPQAGWALVSGDTGAGSGGGDNNKSSASSSSSSSSSGLSIRKKLVRDVSPSIPIHKGEKVIEGFSAEELASVIAEGECRKKWDERFVEERSLEEFGSGVRTGFVVMRGGFPFRDRGFYVVSLVARASAQNGSAVALALSRGGSTDSQSSLASGTAHGALGLGGAGAGGDGGNRTGSRNAIFCVSTSFNPDSVARFDAGKYNPSGLPIGRVYIDAWILETLDPYTKENYAVPSCRCTRLVAVDYAGSVPAAVNSMINASIPRAIAGVEGYVRGLVASLPITRLPPVGYVLAERKEEDVEAEVYGGVKLGWKLRRRREGNRMLVKTMYEPEKRVYTSVVLVRYPGSGTGGEDSGRGLASPNKQTKGTSLSPARHRSSSIHQMQITPKASRVGLNTLPESSSNESSTDTLQVLGDHSTLPLPASPTTSSFSSNSVPPSSTSRREHERERTISGSGSAYRGRSSSAFTLKGEVRQNTDLLAGEIVIDSRLYPKGYMVILKSKTRTNTSKAKANATATATATGTKDASASKSYPPINLDSLSQNSNDVSETSISTPIASSPSSSNPNPNPTSEKEESESESGSDLVLPLSYTLFTMPLSPFHSSGMNTMSGDDKSPTRHLLRLSLPTAQYEISTVRDPLTGETQHAPPKPRWLEEMEEGGVVVTVEVRPLSKGGGSVGKGKVVVVDGMKPQSVQKEKGKNGDKDGKVWNAERDGWEVEVCGEKESLTMLGREELMDDRVSRMGVLSRATNEMEALPEGLSTPVAISDSLLDPNVMAVKNAVSSVDNGIDPTVEDSTESHSVSESNGGAVGGGARTRPGHTPPSSSGGSAGFGGGRNLFLNFWPLYPYPNPLTRFTTNGTASMLNNNNMGGENSGTSLLATRSSTSSGGKESNLGVASEGGGPNSRSERTSPTGLYPVSTLMIIALIAFLIGSLFRSLLSPADFIYVVRDLRDAEGAMQDGGGGGWREMKRLFEIKYIVGGWDFQVAVVRRH